jgi:hypothetical protein
VRQLGMISSELFIAVTDVLQGSRVHHPGRSSETSLCHALSASANMGTNLNNR